MFDSPYRLTALTVACGLGATSGFALGDSPLVYHSLPLLVGCFGLIVVGSLGMYWTAYLLREGVRNERWPEERLLPMRRVVDHVLWKIVLALLATAMIVAVVAYWHHRNGVFWSIFILLQAQTQMGAAFARPRKPRGTGARMDWSKIRPLRSEHWGQR